MDKIMLAVLIFGLLLILSFPYVNQWEKDNDYPFGKLCEVYNSCK